MICDGCNVREPFEHRCHSSGGSGEPIPEMVVQGERVMRVCECEECRGEPVEEINAWGERGDVDD